MPLHPDHVSVTDPVGLAVDRVKQVLFRPFDLGKWFVIGFCAWLASLGEAGFHGGTNFTSPARARGGGVVIDEMRDFVVRNLYWIVPLAVTLAILALAMWIVFTWLSSRGRFMFLHCLARDKAEVAGPWAQFARQGNSLFLFRLVLNLIQMIVLLPLVGLGVFLVYGMIQRGGPEAGRLVGLIAIVLAIIVIAIAFFIVAKLTTDFVVPIMLLRGKPSRESWKELLALLSPNVGRFVLYLLFQIVLAIAVGMVVLALVLGTCCIAGCLMIIPYVGTVLLLPLIAFRRCYSAYYLAQWGLEYDVFAPPAAAATDVPPVG